MTTECRRSFEVERAVASSEWPSDLAAHVAGCEACRETRAVLGFLGRLADADPGAPIPPAGAVFLRSQALARLRRESEAIEAAARPLRVAGAAAGVATLAALGLALGWLAERLPDGLLPGASVILTALLMVSALLVARSWGSDEG